MVTCRWMKISSSQQQETVHAVGKIAVLHFRANRLCVRVDARLWLLSDGPGGRL